MHQLDDADCDDDYDTDHNMEDVKCLFLEASKRKVMLITMKTLMAGQDDEEPKATGEGELPETLDEVQGAVDDGLDADIVTFSYISEQMLVASSLVTCV